MSRKRLLMELLSIHQSIIYQRAACPLIHTRCYTYSMHRSISAKLPTKLPHRRAHAASNTQVEPVLKPLENLGKYTKAPLLPKEDITFDPTRDEIAESQRLFLPSPFHKIEFLKSAVFTEHLPEYDLPEVAFIGRSNVGKSSLIQILLSGVEDLVVKISKTPGHTKTLNFFQVGEKLSIVDMPGYGYRMPDHYVESVENFLHSRPKLCRTFILLDSELGVSEVDMIGLKMLEEFQIPYVVVMTKIDRAKPSKLIKNFMSVLKHRDETVYCFQQPFLVSSVTGDGVALLQSFIAYVSGNFKPEGL